MTPFRPGDRVLLLPALTPGQVLEAEVRINRAHTGVTVWFDGRPAPTTVPMQHLLLDPPQRLSQTNSPRTALDHTDVVPGRERAAHDFDGRTA